MKISKKIKSTVLAGAVLLSVATLYYSCSKEKNQGPPTASGATEPQVISKGQDLSDKISRIRIVSADGKKVGALTQSGGFSFSEPHDGFTFSSPTGVQYVEDPNGGYLYITAAAFSSGGGGMVTAGNSSLDINFTLCLSAADSSEGGFFGPTFSGASIIIGISGDLEAMMNAEGDSTADIGDFFHGIAVYAVFDSPASGNYQIMNFIENMEDSTAWDNKGFAFVMDFQQFSIYFSKEGTLGVDGGSIGFEGKYYAVIPEEGAEDPFDLGDNPDVEVVDGLGTMSCN